MKFAICNLGCKVNNYEANWYSEQLQKKYEEVEFPQMADIYIINSCTVTNTAGAKSRQMMHKARKINPEAVLCVVSCYAQMEFENEDIFRDVDILIGSNHKKELPELIDQFLKTRERIVRVEKFDRTPFEEMDISSFNQTRAYLKIQDGCNQFCTYCVIPLARGRERSLDPDRVIETARHIVDGGHGELVLTGIHTGRYSCNGCSFTALVKRLLAEVEGLKRLRISSIEMNEVTDELIELMKNDERVAGHLHIPLQAGSEAVLRAMHRPYTKAEFLNRVREIRAQVPSVSISSDIIVGFPGETEEMFEESCRFIEEVGFSFLHVFPYAAKKHTIAATLPQQCPAETKKRRVGKLTELSDKLYNDYIQKMPGRKGRVLFERKQNGLWLGHNSEYVVVGAESEDELRGKMVTVRYRKAEGESLLGCIEE